MSNYYEKYGTDEIRRFRLKELCEEALCEKSDGVHDSYGASFQRQLKTLEAKMALRFVRKGRKLTIVKFDIRRVKSLLLDRKYAQFLFNNPLEPREQEVSSNIWEKILEKEFGTRVDDRTRNFPGSSDELARRSYLPIKELIVKLESHLASSFYGFYIEHEDEKFQLSEDAIILLGRAADMIASKNRQQRFNLMTEYKGIPDTGALLGRIFADGLFKNLIPKYFVQWAYNAFNYEVSEEDRKKLTEIKMHHLLSPTAKQYWEIFYDSLRRYISGS